MKKIFSLILTAAVLTGLLTACGSSRTVNVESVAEITGSDSMGTVGRYAGIVVSGQTAEVKKDSNKTVSEVLVQAGDWVNEGDVLFTYDTDAMELALTKLQLEIEGYDATITTGNEQLPQLEQLMNASSGATQASYSLQIQTLKTDIREAEYNKTLKERELELMEASMGDIQVTSPLTGRVMSVKDPTGSSSSDTSSDTSSSSSDSSTTSANVVVTVMDMTTFKVEGKINELNVGSLSEGMSVIIRSRVDEDAVWYGTLAQIDWENGTTTSNTSSFYYSAATDTTTSSTKYPFYVTLDNIDGLILGQHVYIEPDYGQEGQTGIWLPAMYIQDADASPWVWAANSSSRLEKRSITVSEYNAELDEYLVTDGLDLADYIAFPEDDLRTGLTTVPYSSADGTEDYSEDYYTEDYYTEETLTDETVSEDVLSESEAVSGEVMEETDLPAEEASAGTESAEG